MFKHFKLCAALLFYLECGSCSYALADTEAASITPSYQWGRGISLPQAHLNMGGYLTATLDDVETQDTGWSLDEIGFMFTWSPHNKLRFFSEIAFNEWFSHTGQQTLENALRVERLYLDFLATPSVTLRAGKFLTPVGRWNVLHVSPLLWTTSRPLVAQDQLFSGNVNGLMLSKNFQLNERNVDLSVYADNSRSMEPDYNQIGFDNAYGGRVNVEISDDLQLGASYLGFKKYFGFDFQLERNHLFGVDALWQKNNYELQLEMIYRHATDVQGDEKGFYLQGVAPLVGHVFAVGRYEYLNGNHRNIQTDAKIAVAGLTWRPWVPLAIKAEYRIGNQNEFVAPSGFYASFSMFF
jgi:hypothetical protein